MTQPEAEHEPLLGSADDNFLDVSQQRRLFFLLMFIGLIILAIILIRPFFSVLIVSLISVVMLKPVYNRVIEWGFVGGRQSLASGITLGGFILLLIVPLLVLAWSFFSQLASALTNAALADLAGSIAAIVEGFEDLALPGFLDLSGQLIGRAVSTIIAAVGTGAAQLVGSFITELPSLFIQAIIFVGVVGTLLPVFDSVVEGVETVSPLGKELSELYSSKITSMISSLVKGVLLIAVIQGAAMGVVYWIADLPAVLLLAVISTVMALIPMVGISWLVIPMAIVLWVSGDTRAAIIVLFGFYGIVNWIDLILRPRLIEEDARLNYMLFLIAVLGGIAWAGILGLFYGPVIMLLLVTTIQIYAEEFAGEDLDAARGAVGGSIAEPAPDEGVSRG